MTRIVQLRKESLSPASPGGFPHFMLQDREKKHSSCFGLINTNVLVNSDYLLEREREREAGVYNSRKQACTQAFQKNKYPGNGILTLISPATKFISGAIYYIIVPVYKPVPVSFARYPAATPESSIPGINSSPENIKFY
jgi:hypothetical protein